MQVKAELEITFGALPEDAPEMVLDDDGEEETQDPAVPRATLAFNAHLASLKCVRERSNPPPPIRL